MDPQHFLWIYSFYRHPVRESVPWIERFAYGSGVFTNAKIIQEMMPESGVDHMSGNMFHTTIIPVNRHPVFQFIHISKHMSVVRICISQEIPGRSCPLRHGISFTFCCSTTFRASAVYKRINLCKWGLSVFARFEIFNIRQAKRKLIFRNSYNTTVRAMDKRDGSPQYL